MGGISSNGSTVQIELLLTRNNNNDNVNSEDWTQAPEALFLEDKILKIYSMKPTVRKQIDITSATLEQRAAGSLEEECPFIIFWIPDKLQILESP